MTEAPSSAAATRSLRARAVRGSAFVTLGFVARMGLRIGGNLVMTRLLFPHAFGLMALVQVFVAGLELFSDMGLRPSIVRSRRGDDPAFLRTVWTIQVARGAMLWLAACVLAAPLGDFYGQPKLAHLLPVGALVTLIAGFESTALPRLDRHLSLGRRTAIELASQLVAIAVMISWAAFQRSVWALIAGSLAGRLATTVASHLVAEHRDGFGWDRESFRELLGFGSWIFVSTLLTFFANQADRLIFGKLIDVKLLGVYSIAMMFASVPTQLLQRIQVSVVFPALSRTLDGGGSHADLAPHYRRARLPVLAFAGLGAVCLAASGPWLVSTLYDPRYAEAGWILQLLVLGTWLHALASPSGAAMLALGRPHLLAAANAAKVVGIAVLVPLGFALGGFPGAVLGFASAELMRYAALASGAAPLGLSTVGRDVLTSLLAGAAALAGLAAAAAGEARGLPDFLSLGAALATASLLWAGSAQLLARLEGQSLRAVIRSAS